MMESITHSVNLLEPKESSDDADNDLVIDQEESSVDFMPNKKRSPEVEIFIHNEVRKFCLSAVDEFSVLREKIEWKINKMIDERILEMTDTVNENLSTSEKSVDINTLRWNTFELERLRYKLLNS